MRKSGTAKTRAAFRDSIEQQEKIDRAEQLEDEAVARIHDAREHDGEPERDEHREPACMKNATPAAGKRRGDETEKRDDEERRQSRNDDVVVARRGQLAAESCAFPAAFQRGVPAEAVEAIVRVKEFRGLLRRVDSPADESFRKVVTSLAAGEIVDL